MLATMHQVRNPLRPGPVRIPAAADGFAAQPVHQDGEDHDQHVDRFAPAVEEQRDDQQNQIAPAERNGLVDQHHNRQICEQKCQTAEYHWPLPAKIRIHYINKECKMAERWKSLSQTAEKAVSSALGWRAGNCEISSGQLQTGLKPLKCR
jgi:hypothetical protein